ncbi:type IV pilin protein [Lysobacter enzymogenes]|uniref:Type 4 fimbrial biogenesis protein PilE n=2 Tax=Bacteria TaxID=2 RepID=A0AAU9AHH4_LYSEN|nr:type IV pilin protein [Lysobacter enzymogenes]BAV96994.1 type 4 fimbrial biogenesis protein PilE [Lysobacter enzymogenes]
MSRNTITAIHCRAPSRRSLGFTLIELMIAVAIVGILAGIAYPAYNDAIRKSRRAQAKADLAELSQRAERWYTAKNSYAGFFAKVKADNLDYSPRDRPRAEAFYAISRDGGADAADNTFVLTAAPQGDQVKDVCMSLSVDAAGKKTTNSSRTDCW